MSAIPVTVLMSVRNGEPYLETSIKSILNQTCRNFNFLILDNASTDRSRELIRGFLDSRIKLVEFETDLGQTNALNEGLAIADTPYIARIDADDIALPNRIEKQLGFLNKHPEFRLIGSWFDIIDSDGAVLNRQTTPSEYIPILKEMLFENPFAHSSVMYCRETALVHGGYDAAFKCAQDYALWWRIARTHPVAILPEFLAQIRVHSQQTSRSFDLEVVWEPFRIAMEALNRSDLPVEVQPLAQKAHGYADLKFAAGIAEGGCLFRAILRMIQGLYRAPGLVCSEQAQTQIARVMKTTWLGKVKKWAN